MDCQKAVLLIKYVGLGGGIKETATEDLQETSKKRTTHRTFHPYFMGICLRLNDETKEREREEKRGRNRTSSPRIHSMLLKSVPRSEDRLPVYLFACS